MEKKPVIKTFGGRKNSIPKSTIPKSTEQSLPRSSSFSSVSSVSSAIDDKDLLLQQKIDKAILDDQVETRKLEKLRQKAKFDDGLSSGSDPEFDEEGLGLKRAKAGRSLHEIVEAGENNRFFDEIEYLVDGLAIGSLKGRILCMEDLIGKVQKSFEFGSRMRAHGMLTKAIGNLSDLVDTSPKARCGIAFLLVHLCHDIRKLIVFISAKQLIHLASLMIASTGKFEYSTQLKETIIFKDFPIERLTESLAGLWALAKFFQAAEPCDQTTQSIIAEESLLSSVLESINMEQLDQVEFLKIRWAMVLLDHLQPLDPDLFPLLLDWALKFLNSQSSQSVQGNLALLLVLKVLLRFDSIHLAQILEKVFAFGLALLQIHDEEDDEIAIIAISLMINFVERSEDAREALRCLPGSILPNLSRRFSSLKDSPVRDSLAFLLSILMIDNRTNQTIIRENVSASALAECIKTLLSTKQSLLPASLTLTLQTLMTQLQSSTRTI